MKFLVGTLISLLCLNVSASTLPGHWMLKKEHSPVNFKSNDNYDLDETLASIQESYQDGLEEIEEQGPRWKLESVVTRLALGLSGKVGLLGWGGTKMAELEWKRRDEAKAPEKPLSSEAWGIDEDLSVDQNMEKLEPLTAYLQERGDLKNPENFRTNLRRLVSEVVVAAAAANHSGAGKWQPHKLRLEFTVAANGSLSGAVTSLGADVRVRLEWTRKRRSAPLKSNSELSPEAVEMVSMLQTMSHEVSRAVEDTENNKHIEVDGFNVGLSLSAGGGLGNYSASINVSGRVYFKKQDSVELDNKITLQDEISLQPSKGGDFKLSREKIRKGLKKAIRFGEYFGKKLAKRKHRRGKWGVRSIKVRYEFSLGGDLGVVSLEGEPLLEISFLNKNFNQQEQNQ